MTFCDTRTVIAMPHANPSSSDAERRRTKRYALDEQRSLTAISGGKVYTCYIEDVSMSGVRLRFEGRAPKGKVIALEHPTAGTICGECVWHDDSALGVELRLPDSDLERVLKCICMVL